jgi:hypothetical protein
MLYQGLGNRVEESYIFPECPIITGALGAIGYSIIVSIRLNRTISSLISSLF